MTEERFKKFEKELLSRGYKRYDTTYHSSDFWYGKSFGSSDYEHGRSDYIVSFCVYDLSRIKPDYVCYGVSPYIDVSRFVDERIIFHAVEDDEKSTDIDRIESLAKNFFRFVEQVMIVR